MVNNKRGSTSVSWTLYGGFRMLEVIASAPGKVTLFGEHAVVYGYPAIVAAINCRTYVRARLRNDKLIRIIAKDLVTPGVHIELGSDVHVSTTREEALKLASYVLKAVEVTSNYLNTKKGVDLEVWSEMPVGAGLGTSAAVSVATIVAYSTVVGCKLRKEEIARLGWKVEKEVQGAASPMDTSAVTYGGFLKIWREGSEWRIRPLNSNHKIPLIIAYIKRSSTTKDMVLSVKNLRDRYPRIIDGIMELIGKVTLEAEKALINHDINRLGELMNINHGLLEAIGVSTRELNMLVYLARLAGARGAKLTGAGGGGCIIALAPKRGDAVKEVLKLYAGKVFKIELGAEGVKALVKRS